MDLAIRLSMLNLWNRVQMSFDDGKSSQNETKNENISVKKINI